MSSGSGDFASGERSSRAPVTGGGAHEGAIKFATMSALFLT
jgi:hypothetical protein